jgi:methylenetetrahydrofolate reductase (NADPH)
VSTAILERVDARAALKGLMGTYSTELTTRDTRSLDAAPDVLAPGSEVFIASLPNDSLDGLVATAVQLRRAGLTPVPHIVARNFESLGQFDELLAGLVGEAGVDRMLPLGGDRDRPAAQLHSSLQLIESGLIQKHGISKIFMSCYPEAHPRIADEVLEQARADKLAAAKAGGLDVTLVSQFCFDARPIVEMTRRMRAEGTTVPYRVGVAGPAERATLVRYALMCGVGASLRALKERQALARNMLTGETPETLLTEIAVAQAENPALRLEGVHLFAFGGLAKSADWAQSIRR